MSRDQLYFEELLAYHCAPTLKKQKPANMFHIYRTEINDLETIVDQYNKVFESKGIHIRLFQADKKRVTVYVYCPALIEYILQKRDTQEFLNSFHYPDHDIEKKFIHLEKRLNSSNSYPHEIGIFLGYPLEDVLGFLNNERCLCIQDWKVYKNVEKTKKIFKLFETTRKQFIDAVENGERILSLI